ncbi:MAG: AAA family ATPase [Patescibacteria group bacterium]|jgi:chromosome segregation protein
MYLQKLEIQGFKSFANRTILEFPSANGNGKGITAVVGPNGSGKSNIADAIRWVLGEQSMKTLRGKKSEDVIFFGSDKKARVGMAEVSLYLNNEDGAAAIDYSELVITRRLYRDGESEYLLNKAKVRLSDIQILLAKANFGQRTYSVIGQGMVDHFLVASQAERKEFFDEAAGVKEYQMKKNQTINQLERTRENLKQTEITLGELGPRYRSLSRMIKRLEQREVVEKELRELQAKYYGSLYSSLNGQWEKHREEFSGLESRIKNQEVSLKDIQKQLDSLEQEESGQEVFAKLQQEFNQFLDKKNNLREKQLQLQHRIDRAKEEARQDFVPLSVDEMVKELEDLLGLHDELSGHLAEVKEVSHLDKVKEKVNKVVLLLRALLKKVKKPEKTEVKVDESLTAELKQQEQELAGVEKSLAAAQEKIAEFNRSQQEKKGAFFDLQRQFSGKQNELNQLSITINDVKIELAKVETKKEDLMAEIRREMGENKEIGLPAQAGKQEMSQPELSEAYSQIQRLKHQLELIGGLDEESLKEFAEIKERFEFLQAQYDDLTKAMASLEEVLKKLDGEIHERFDQTFQNINVKFGEYFKKLFGGGKADLEKIMFEVKEDEESEVQSPESREEKPNLRTSDFGLRTNKKEYEYGGVEIRACPPGKKISNLNTLSGGERAMTAIGLICAIIACNPSPFVVLDEVDAALDEANSDRFSAILDELSHHTQFIVVTHNRASMRRSNVLYGVTMGDDGMSKLLSVKLEQGERWAK